MFIKKYRTIAHIYPILSFEAEVLLEDGRTVYPNISVNNKGLKEEYCEDNFWVYNSPITEVLFEAVDNYYVDLTKEDTEKIITAMLDIWNANPVFDNNSDWKII